MSNLTREEREQRIARDDGNGDDTVWASAEYQSVRAYHDHEDCQRFVADKTRTTTREHAQRRMWFPCATCVLGDESFGTPGTSLAKALRRDDVTSLAEAQEVLADD